MQSKDIFGRGMKLGLFTRQIAFMSTSAIALTFPSAAVAQGVAATEGGDPQLEEIIVTAQKRGQNLQDVPLSVSAFSSEVLQRAGIQRVQDVAQIDPSLNIPSSSGVVLPFLRGVGNPGGNAMGNEASVPVYIDDVYYTRLNPAYMSLNNIERVEVLKGPQGTLFGRNASGGLIHVITRDPSMTAPALDASLGYATYQTVSGQLYASTPISDGVAADIAVSAARQQNGWGKNLNTGEDVGRQRFVNIRSKLLIEAGPETKIRLTGFYVWNYTEQGLQNTIYRGTVSATPPLYGPAQALLPPRDFYDSDYGFVPDARQEGWGGALKIEQGLGFAELVSISAYRKANEHLLAGGYSSRFNFLSYDLRMKDRQFTQELQLKSLSSSKIQWILGAFHMNSKQGYVPAAVSGDAITATGGSELRIFGLQTVKSYAAFGQSTFPVVDEKTNITLGLRYTSDRVHGEGRQEFEVPGVGVFPGQVPYDDSVTFDKLTYKVAVDHHLDDDTMAFLSFSRGYKSGTFNTLPLDQGPASAEVVDAYELGIKSELLDRRLRMNLSVFQNNIKNPQVSAVITTGGASFIGLTNAQSAKVRGIELSVDALVTDGLSARFGGSYLDAKYTDFTNAPFYFPASGLPQNGGTCPGATAGAAPVPTTTGGICPPVVRDATGNRLAQVPKWRFNAGLNYGMESSVGTFTADANVSYTGRFAWDADNLVEQRPYALVNASLTYELPDNDRWSFQIWAKNLTGSKYYLSELPLVGGSGNTAAVGAPLTAGAEIRFKL